MITIDITPAFRRQWEEFKYEVTFIPKERYDSILTMIRWWSLDSCVSDVCAMVPSVTFRALTILISRTREKFGTYSYENLEQVLMEDCMGRDEWEEWYKIVSNGDLEDVQLYLISELEDEFKRAIDDKRLVDLNKIEKMFNLI